jgi:hypothetical protein
MLCDQHETYLHARLPRVECPRECSIKTVEVPWTRSGNGFTALFEALIMVMAREMPVAAIAALVGEHNTRIWRVLHHHVEEARSEADFSEVQRVGVDEMTSRRGHIVPILAQFHQSLLRSGCKTSPVWCGRPRSGDGQRFCG